MNKEHALKKSKRLLIVIKKIHLVNKKYHGKMVLKTMEVYKIPLAYLVYNKYNGRILSRTQSLENQKQKIDAELEEGKALIEDLLWKSKIDRNKKTFTSINEAGQEKVGIITKDGIIIDGNRRVMLLNKGEKV